jgi:CheY-like chemotaxis protein
MEIPDTILPRGGRAMVLTDEASVLSSITRGLGPFGLACEAHALTTESVRNACSKRFDLILVDMRAKSEPQLRLADHTLQLLKALPHHETVPIVALCPSVGQAGLANVIRLCEIVLEAPLSIARVRAAVFTAFLRKRSISLRADILRAGQSDVGLSKN